MKQFLLGVLGLAFVACHGGGADPGPGGKLKAGAVCEDVATAACDRLDQCGPTTDCLDTLMNACCTGAACDQQTNYSQAQVDACTRDIKAESCPDLTSGQLPASCN